MIGPQQEKESHESLRAKSNFNFALFSIVVILVPLLLLVLYWDRIMPLVRDAYEGQARADRTAQANERSLQALRDSASLELRQSQEASGDLEDLASRPAAETTPAAAQPSTPGAAPTRSSDQAALDEMKRSGQSSINSFR